MSATSKLQRCPRLDSTKCWRLRSIIFEAVVVTARLLLLLSSLQLSIVYLVCIYLVHSMLCSSIVVGIQAQPDSISLSQLYYDRSKGYLSSIIHNKNHNATRYFRAKLWLWLSLIQFFSPPRGIWLVASNMEYDGCRQLRYCCCAMLCQGWLAAARHFTRRALCTGASSSERPAKMISKTQARHHRREEGKPIKRPRVATSDLRERWAMCLRPGSST